MEWSGCTRPCGGGQQTQVRAITQEASGDAELSATQGSLPSLKLTYPENRPSQKETSLPTSNHPFSGAMLVSGRVNHPKRGNQAIHICGKFEGIFLITMRCLGW